MVYLPLPACGVPRGCVQCTASRLRCSVFEHAMLVEMCTPCLPYFLFRSPRRGDIPILMRCAHIPELISCHVGL